MSTVRRRLPGEDNSNPFQSFENDCSTLGDSYKNTNPRQAIKQYYKAIAINEETRDFDSTIFAINMHCKIGYCHYKLKEYSEAYKAYQIALDHTLLIQSDPQHNSIENISRFTANLHTNLGGLDLILREYSKAKAKFEMAIQCDKTYANAHSGLGDVYRSEHAYHNSISKFKEALALNPQLPSAYAGLGLTYTANQEYANAVDAFKKLVELTPSDKESNKYLDDAIKIYLENEAKASKQSTREPTSASDTAVRFYQWGSTTGTFFPHARAMDFAKTLMRTNNETQVNKCLSDEIDHSRDDTAYHQELLQSFSKLVMSRPQRT